MQLEHTELGQFAGLFPGRKVTLTELDLSFVTAARRRALGFEKRFAVDRLLWSDPAGYRRLLRYEIRSAAADPMADAATRGLDEASLFLRTMKFGHRGLKADVVDMTAMWEATGTSETSPSV